MTHNNFAYHTVIDTALNYVQIYGLNLNQVLVDNVLTLSITKTVDDKNVVFDTTEKELFRVQVNLSQAPYRSTLIYIDSNQFNNYIADELYSQIRAELNKVEKGYEMSEWTADHSNLLSGLYFVDVLTNEAEFDYLYRGSFPLKETVNNQRIFFDMDGILAEWNKNASMEEVFSKGYFESLKPMQGTIDLFKALQDKGYECYILSKARGDKVSEKIEWLKKYMPFIHPENVIFVPLEANKSNFIFALDSTDILIDDYNNNLEDWRGIAVKGLNGINSVNDDYESIDLSFYKLYDDCGNEQEIKECIDRCVKEIDHIASHCNLDYDLYDEMEIGS